MSTTPILAAAGSGYLGFIAGFLLGAAVSFLLGPAVRSWLAYREWTEASRQADLTDQILARMQEDGGPAPATKPRSPGTSPKPWPASR
jgi:hypothetical protein